MNIKPTKTPGITIADQPSGEEIDALREKGYTAVVNLRNDGEPEQPIGTVEEGERVRASGLDYLHYGVSSTPLTEEGVTSVSEFLNRHSGEGEKVLVHCRKGSRASALVLLHEAKARGWSGDEALARGRELGLEVEGGLRNLVEGYLRSHPAGG